jgi:glutamate dehydrogenase (NAD(P)+)
VKEAGLSDGLGGKRVVVQGFGNVGYHATKFLFEEDGCKIIAVTDSKGVLVNEEGLDIEAAYRHKVETRTLDGFPGGRYEKGSTKRALEMECDILIPAALEGQIDIENVDRIKAKLIIEAANGPITFAADEKLNEWGVIIIPDAYVNAIRKIARSYLDIGVY